MTGTTDMNPIDKQLDLLLKIVPKTRTIGILYNSSEINSQIQVKKMKELAEAKGSPYGKPRFPASTISSSPPRVWWARWTPSTCLRTT